MASESENGASTAAAARASRFMDLLMSSVRGGRDRDPGVFFPILVGVMGPSGRDGGGDEAEANGPRETSRIVLVNPLTQGMVVLRSGDGDSGRDLASLMREIISSDGAGGPPPASKTSIEAMRTVDPPEMTGDGGSEQEEECAVCLDVLWAADLPLEEEKDEEKGGGKREALAVKEMPCRHIFHGECIEKWLGLHGSCPVCRYRMPEEERRGGKKGGDGDGEREEEEGEENRRAMRRVVEREIWVTVEFGRSDRENNRLEEQQQHQHQQQQDGEES